MITGSIPTTSIHGTWVETVEVMDITNNTPWDWGSTTEATVMLRWPQMGAASLGYNELTLKKSNGDVILPVPGILQWRAEATRMATLTCGLYEVLVLLKDNTDTTSVLMLGTVSVVQ
jgi:hypothetical protein